MADNEKPHQVHFHGFDVERTIIKMVDEFGKAHANTPGSAMTIRCFAQVYPAFFRWFVGEINTGHGRNLEPVARAWQTLVSFQAVQITEPVQADPQLRVELFQSMFNEALREAVARAGIEIKPSSRIILPGDKGGTA